MQYVIGGTSTGVVVVWETLAKPAGMEAAPDADLVRPPPNHRGTSLIRKHGDACFYRAKREQLERF